MRCQGLYLNRWTPDFDPAEYVPSAVPVWVRLPNLPVHCWNWDSFQHIGNALGKFIDRPSTKEQYDYARICVEVDLEVGLPKAIKINAGSWTHVQKLDYEQLPFKCRKCQEYRQFAKNCTKNEEAVQGKEEGWKQVKRSRANHKPSNPPGATKGKWQQPSSSSQGPQPKAQENAFAPLSSASIEVKETKQ